MVYCKAVAGISWLFVIMLLIPTHAMADSFNTYYKRCEPYRTEIEQILESNGVSAEYFYLALAESGCVFDSKSKAGAVGLWQLMPSTARNYGLQVDHTIDERLDWKKSTEAAARYLKSLSQRFVETDWVVAAYNAGGSNLVKKTGFTKGCGLRIATIRTIYPQAYNLVLTVRRFRQRGEV